MLGLALAIFRLSNTPTPSVFAATTSCVDATDDLGGTVWRDYDSDGFQDAGESAFDGRHGPMIVSAYDNAGFVISSTVSITGTYTFDDIFMGRTGDDANIRLEFSGLPNWVQSGVQGANNGTTVQFYDAATCTANLAVHNPADYCDTSPLLATSCYILGGNDDLRVSFEGGSYGLFVEWPQTNRGDPVFSVGYASPTKHLSNFDDVDAGTAGVQSIGAVYGLAYQRSTQTYFIGAFAKRHSDYGPDGSGAIYTYHRQTSAVTTLTTLSAGSTARGTGDPGEEWFHDAAFFDSPGKEGLGDIDLSEDEKTLYVVNLFDRHLYRVDVAVGSPTYGNVTDLGAISTGGGATSTDIANPNWRPFALEVHDGNLYVGGVFTGAGDLSVHVLRATISGASASFTEVFTHVLPTARGRAWMAISASNTWHPWVSTLAGIPAANMQFFAGGQGVAYPTPLLTDLEFDRDGSMIFGFRDRTGDQLGFGAGDTSTAVATLYYYISGGDLNRACWNAATDMWEWEGEGNCANHFDSTDTSLSGGPYGGTQAVGTEEFYPGEFAISAFFGILEEHREVAQGGLALRPQLTDIATTAMDPVRLNSGGILFLDNTTGRSLLTDQRGYELFSSPSNEVPLDEAGKSNGLGDLELVCAVTPLEIGNRIWHDSDGDGVQDPAESAIQGVTVMLHDMDDGGTQVGTATTDINGYYIFGGLSATNMTSGTLQSETNYEIRVSLSDGALPASVDTIAPPNATGVTTNDKTDLADSDASESGGNAVIAFATGDAGENNHTLDIGFYEAPVASIAVEKRLNTSDPVLPSVSITFTIRITNTGTTTITSLPLTDTYSSDYLTYVGLRTTPESDSNADSGEIVWSDLTQATPNGFGQDFGPSDSWDVVVEFETKSDTTSLPNSVTINTAHIMTHTVTDTVRIFNPTGITLINREIVVGETGITLQWETVDETNLIGFHVLRLDPSLQEPVQLTSDADIIIATYSGSADGDTYRYEDTTAIAGVNYHYKIQLITADDTHPLMDIGSVNPTNTTQVTQWHMYLPILQR